MSKDNPKSDYSVDMDHRFDQINARSSIVNFCVVCWCQKSKTAVIANSLCRNQLKLYEKTQSQNFPLMMAKCPSIGAIGKTKMVNLHPSEPLKTWFGMRYNHDHLDGLIILGKDKGKVSRKGRVIDPYSIQHLGFPNVNFFFIAAKNFTVVEEGPTPFGNLPIPNLLPGDPVGARNSTEEESHLIQPGRRISSDKISELHNQASQLMMTMNLMN